MDMDQQGSEQLERLKVALADKYAVERELGMGGMAIVYLARDIKHDRNVAIKVLLPDLAASVGSERFLREIQVTAKLQHPHILPLYDSGAAEGFLYYVMPLIEGETLADLIEREKQLSLKDAVRFAREVAEALGHAHSYGLIHRDIKPSNIYITGGHAVVADFGIARAVEEAGGEKLTQTGMAIGTPAYMAPEQGMGEPNVDGRADIYALGCVLYEMLVGQVPFTGPTPMAILARHSMDHIPAPHIMRDTIPPDLEEIVYCAMAKQPADRYRTAREMVEALDQVDTMPAAARRASEQYRASMAMRVPVKEDPRWKRAVVTSVAAFGVVAFAVAGWALLGGRGAGGTTAVGGLDPQRIAVLYFEDLSPNDTLAFLADGITEALIERLAGVPRLTVLSRHAVAQYRDSDVAPDSVARALEVGSLVTGSVQMLRDNVQVTVQLLDGFSGASIERRGFTMPADQVLAVRDSVVELASGFLRTRVGEEVRARERRASTRNLEAWSLLQRAERLRKEGNELEQPDPAAALRAYLQADSLAALAEAADRSSPDPAILRGWVSYDRMFLAREDHERAARLRETITFADRALGIEPGDAVALDLRGRARFLYHLRRLSADPAEHSRLLEQAEADLQAAVRADPRLANAWSMLSNLQYTRADIPAALIAAERAYEADAFLGNPRALLNQLFQGHYDLEQFPSSQRWCQEGARRFPEDERFVRCQLLLMLTPRVAPDVERAWALARAWESIAPEERRERLGRAARMYVGGVLARARLADSARNVMVAARAEPDIDPGQELAFDEAAMRVILGDTDEAVRLLSRYHAATGDRLDLSHWWWRPLRDHPGLRTIGGR